MGILTKYTQTHPHTITHMCAVRKVVLPRSRSVLEDHLINRNWPSLTFNFHSQYTCTPLSLQIHLGLIRVCVLLWSHLQKDWGIATYGSQTCFPLFVPNVWSHLSVKTGRPRFPFSQGRASACLAIFGSFTSPCVATRAGCGPPTGASWSGSEEAEAVVPICCRPEGTLHY